MKITDADAQEFGRTKCDELATEIGPWPNMVEDCVVIGFLECRRRLIEGLKQRFEIAEKEADGYDESLGIVGEAFKQAIAELEHGNG